MTKVETATHAVLTDYGRVYAGVTEILKREPKTDGEMAGVNTCFIELNKRLSRLPLGEYTRWQE